MKCFVTGASGFVGANLVHELLRQGHEVVALVRGKSDLRGLEGAHFDRTVGDIRDHRGLMAAMKGCDWCFHVAASYRLWMRDYREMYESNVEGTRNVITAATEAGCSRIVYTSTVGCIGLPSVKNGALIPGNELTPVTRNQMTNHYKRSKWDAEQVARELAGRGHPVVIVNPSAPVGPRDVKPTPTGRMILDFLSGGMPAYVNTGLNWVHVKDVAAGHILAAEKGKIGERYILGHKEGNWSLKDTLSVLSELTGRPAPRMCVPHWVAYMAACVDEAAAHFMDREPKATRAGVRMSKYMMFFDPSKAIRELGLPQTPPRRALQEAVEWFTAQKRGA